MGTGRSRLVCDLDRAAPTGARTKSGPVEMAVLAEPGRDMWEHMAVVQEWGSRVQPDVLIYQWYVNDIEVVERRPRFHRAWQRRWSQHERLRNSSYLYYFLDHMTASWLPQPERSYTEYILQDFGPGTYAWTEFERAFHSFATRARRQRQPVDRALSAGALPRPVSPQPIHDRMAHSGWPSSAVDSSGWVGSRRGRWSRGPVEADRSRSGGRRRSCRDARLLRAENAWTPTCA